MLTMAWDDRSDRMRLRGGWIVLAAVAAAVGGPAAAAPERLWRVQNQPAAQNAGAMQMQAQLIDQLRRVQVEVPAGMVMTLDQIDRLNALFALNEGTVATRDGAKAILGLN
jgi:hypothetical protein